MTRTTRRRRSACGPGTGTPWPIAIGDRLSLGGRNVTTLVHQTGSPRGSTTTASPGHVRPGRPGLGFRSAAGAPISVGGRLWGVVTVGSAHKASLPADTEARLGAFTELVGTSIANAEAQAALAASAPASSPRPKGQAPHRAGPARRRAAAPGHPLLQLREIQATTPPGAGDLARRLDGVGTGLDDALEELREIARGIHPAVLAQGGLRPALQALAGRCPSRSTCVSRCRPAAGPAEIAAYYVVSEALTNTARHAGATAATVEVTCGEGTLRVRVRDDGRGGADLGQGAGLVGLEDRVEALGGRLALGSSSGAGTSLDIHIPLGGSVRGC